MHAAASTPPCCRISRSPTCPTRICHGTTGVQLFGRSLAAVFLKFGVRHSPSNGHDWRSVFVPTRYPFVPILRWRRVGWHSPAKPLQRFCEPCKKAMTNYWRRNVTRFDRTKPANGGMQVMKRTTSLVSQKKKSVIYILFNCSIQL